MYSFKVHRHMYIIRKQRLYNRLVYMGTECSWPCVVVVVVVAGFYFILFGFVCLFDCCFYRSLLLITVESFCTLDATVRCVWCSFVSMSELHTCRYFVLTDTSFSSHSQLPNSWGTVLPLRQWTWHLSTEHRRRRRGHDQLTRFWNGRGLNKYVWMDT